MAPRGANPELLRFIEVLYGYHENFLNSAELAAAGIEDTRSRRHRLVVIAHLRVPGTVPLFAGFRANVGRGRDDLRIHVALRFNLDRLAALVAP